NDMADRHLFRCLEDLVAFTVAEMVEKIDHQNEIKPPRLINQGVCIGIAKFFGVEPAVAHSMLDIALIEVHAEVGAMRQPGILTGAATDVQYRAVLAQHPPAPQHAEPSPVQAETGI